MSFFDLLGAVYSAQSDIFDGYFKVKFDEMNDSLMRERTIYHQDGTKTVFRNYAIVKSDQGTYKAPIMEEGRIVQIGT